MNWQRLEPPGIEIAWFMAIENGFSGHENDEFSAAFD
jgi:hypothetical protein